MARQAASEIDRKKPKQSAHGTSEPTWGGREGRALVPGAEYSAGYWDPEIFKIASNQWGGQRPVEAIKKTFIFVEMFYV